MNNRYERNEFNEGCNNTEHINSSDIYKLPEEEIAIADQFVKLLSDLMNSRPCNYKHLAALLKYVGDRVFRVRGSLGDRKDEIELQKMDLEHKLSLTDFGSEEWACTLKSIGDTILERRTAKDIWTIASVISTNLNRSGNFILGMNKREYTPRSTKYKENSHDDKKKPNPTTVKIGSVKR